MCVKRPLSPRNVENLLRGRGSDIGRETVRFSWNGFGPVFAAEMRKQRVAPMRGYPRRRWRSDEALAKIDGRLRHLWRAVDREGEVLETAVAAKRNKAAALKFPKRILKKYGRPETIATDGLCSCPAATKERGVGGRREAGRRLDDRAENSHRPSRRRERAMETLQKFSSIHAPVHNHFDQQRHLVNRDVHQRGRSAAPAERRALAARSTLGFAQTTEPAGTLPLLRHCRFMHCYPAFERNIRVARSTISAGGNFHRESGKHWPK